MMDISQIKLSGTVSSFKDIEARKKTTAYTDLTEASNFDDEYVFLKDGSLWHDETAGGASTNSIDIIGINSKIFKLVVHQPLKIDYLMSNGAAFDDAIKRGFELSETIVCSNKTYTIKNDYITIPQNCSLLGPTIGSANIESTVEIPEDEFYSYTADIILKSNSTLKNICFSSSNSQYDVWVQDNSCSIVNCSFNRSNSGGAAIYCYSTENSVIRDCIITGKYNQGISLYDVSVIFIKNLYMPSSSKVSNGIYMASVQKLCMNGCVIYANTYPITTSTISSYRSEHCFFTDCVFTSNKTTSGNVSSPRSQLYYSRNFSFSNCQFASGGLGTGLYLYSCTGVSFSGCLFYNNGYYGCQTYLSKIVMFRSCNFGKNNLTNTSSVKSNLYLQGGTTSTTKKVSIGFNECIFSDEDLTATSNTGIKYYNAQYGNYVGNIFVGITTPINGADGTIASNCNSTR